MQIKKQKGDENKKVKLEWKDYIALFIAALESVAVPFFLLLVAMLLIYFILAH